MYSMILFGTINLDGIPMAIAVMFAGKFNQNT
jgi:hypothetical protein